MSDTTAITIRLGADVDMAIGRLANAEHISKSTMTRKFMEERLEQYRIEKAIELYVNEKGSLKEISEITGVTVRMIMGNAPKEEYTAQNGRRGV
jgi:membrane-bound lytic murein transglycosylase B